MKKAPIFFLFMTLYSSLAFSEDLVLLPSARKGLDTNDVSILFPLNIKLKRFTPNIDLKDLITPTVFEQVLKFQYPEREVKDLPYADIRFVSDIERWRIVALRINTCDDHFTTLRSTADYLVVYPEANKCQPKLRLVAQPVDVRWFPIATALHLLYEINEKQLQSMTQLLFDLKDSTYSRYGIETTGLPLMVHPALQRENDLPEKALSVSKIVEKIVSIISSSSQTVNPDVLTLTIHTNIDSWAFVGGLVENNNWKKFTTPFNQQFYLNEMIGVEKIICERTGTGASVECLSTPNKSPASQENKNVLSYLFRPLPEGEKIDMTLLEIYQLAERVDSPLKTNFFNTNCLSCHQSSNHRNREMIYEPSSPQGITPFTLSQYTSLRKNNIINFGYFGSSPRISTRTAAESAHAAHTLNSNFQLENPSTVIKNQTQFWICLMARIELKQCLDNQSQNQPRRIE
jgi:hypothetical protein